MNNNDEIIIKIDKSPKIKLILFIAIIVVFIGANIIFINFLMSAFLSFILFIACMFGLDQKTLDNNFYITNIFMISLILLIILAIALVFLIYLYKKKKIEVIDKKIINNKCLKCGREFISEDSKCPDCEFDSNIEYTCNKCYTINSINRTKCIKCEEEIETKDLINCINKKMTVIIIKVLLLSIISFLYLKIILAFIITIFILSYYYKKLKELLDILEMIKKE